MSTPTNFKDIMEKAKEVQKKMKQAKAVLSKEKVEGNAGAGFVKVTMNGDSIALAVHIDPNMLKEAVRKDETKLLEELMLSAYNDAHHKAQQLSKDTLMDLTADLKIEEDAA